MYKSGDIVKVLLPNAINAGYDYRLTNDADTGQLVHATLMNRPIIGVIIGPGTDNVPANKIKTCETITNYQLPITTLEWIQRMSAYTMMAPGAVLKLILNVPEVFTPPKMETLYIPATGASGRITEQRQHVYDAFASNDNDAMTVYDIQNIARVSPAVIRKMIETGILVASGNKPKSETGNRKPEYFDTKNITLSDEQQSVANKISSLQFPVSSFQVHVLDGITGSGKTQVYFDACMRAYLAKKSVLIMMPEIALTAQFIQRFIDKFGHPPVVWHSNLSATKRRDIWRGVASGDIRIVIGTRSALFLPWQDLGLIVVDEEHDTSYKQEEMGNYHARDMAILRASISDFPIILASATPSAETIKNISDGKYKHHILTSRFGGASLPSIELVDLRKNEINNQQSAISNTLSNAITETLANKQQVMLFINRRGFAHIIQCKNCGWCATCTECSCGMTHHKKTNNLICHVCGRRASMPAKCTDCTGEVSMRGIGVEKIYEEATQKWPDANIEIVSSDTVSSRQSLERLVYRIESGETNIIIGTQILAKGHHFPNLTLVGAVDADMGLFGTDFRAAERTFQQLLQVAGRAGRGKIPGRVLLQTYQPEHPVLKSIVGGDATEFITNDLAGRRIAKMPPYGNLIAIIIECENERKLLDFCNLLANAKPRIANQESRTMIMGPIPAPIYQIRKWYRMRFLVSGDVRDNLQKLVKTWLENVKVPANIKIKIDVNPQSFM
ncbi:MAG: primosomal protein N' [Alphaproteobacteria bacterium]|nr:primosomal protein N' [Alphaproteobacteria bacterium]